ncbi:MAG: outer membrane lipoprotein carrier protein LolA [Rhodospirillaceae bacterium]
MLKRLGFLNVTARAAFALAAFAAAGFAVSGGPARAEYRITAEDRSDIARIEAYLNSVDSLKSEFVQLASGGGVAQGTIYIERPNRLRLDYRKPATMQVYANGNWLVHVDTELEAVTHIPIGSTPAGFLVQDRIRLSGDVTVDRVIRGDSTISVELVQTGDREAGRFVLTFSDAPLQLRQWTVTDAQGVTTNVQLVAPAVNVAIPRDVFVFDETRYEREMP